MIEDHIQQQIRRRLEWALTDHREALAKLYALPSLKITPEDRATWTRVTSYLANVESHLVNMIARVPDLFTEEDRCENRRVLKQAFKEITEPPWYLK